MYRLLPWILEEEEGRFRRIDNKWRPLNLLVEPHRRDLLRDIQWRFKTLDSARDELASLDHGPQYIKRLIRMRFWVRRATFAWRRDDLALIKAIASFYVDYGYVLRMLKRDRDRGRLKNVEEGV